MKQTDLEKKIEKEVRDIYSDGVVRVFGCKEKHVKNILSLISQDRQSLVEELRAKKMKLKNPDPNLAYTQMIYNTAITDILAIIEGKNV